MTVQRRSELETDFETLKLTLSRLGLELTPNKSTTQFFGGYKVQDMFDDKKSLVTRLQGIPNSKHHKTFRWLTNEKKLFGRNSYGGFRSFLFYQLRNGVPYYVIDIRLYQDRVTLNLFSYTSYFEKLQSIWNEYI